MLRVGQLQQRFWVAEQTLIKGYAMAGHRIVNLQLWSSLLHGILNIVIQELYIEFKG